MKAGVTIAVTPVLLLYIGWGQNPMLVKIVDNGELAKGFPLRGSCQPHG